jgi:hypothetical protein
MPAMQHGYWLAAFIGLTALCTNALGQLPQVKTQGVVSYVSGGVGDDEEAAIRSAAKEYGVLLEFTEVERGTSHGRWTADVGISIKAGNEVVLNARADGPLMLVKLKPGSYVAEADRQGAKLTKRLEVKASAVTRERFFWIVEGPLTPR